MSSNDFEKIWKEAVLTKYEVLCWHLPGETGEDNEKRKRDGLQTEIRTQNFLHMKQEATCCVMMLGVLFFRKIYTML